MVTSTNNAVATVIHHLTHTRDNTCTHVPSPGPERVSQRDRSPVRIQLGPVQSELLFHRHHLRREGLVHLDDVDVGQALPRALKEGTDGRRGADAAARVT